MYKLSPVTGTSSFCSSGASKVKVNLLINESFHSLLLCIGLDANRFCRAFLLHSVRRRRVGRQVHPMAPSEWSDIHRMPSGPPKSDSCR